METIIVGGGQAGLALSAYLRGAGREHLVIEQGRVAERWRSERWDSLAFQFPNWSLALPGHAYHGDDPDGFAPRDEVVAFLEHYATMVGAPVRSGVRVTALEATPGSRRFLVRTDHGALEATSVVVATGPYQAPALPTSSAAFPADIVQVHSSRYRNPAQLPPGGVLVVGSGASGCQIVEDLVATGREVHFSVGRHRRLPRRYRGRDVFWWLGALGRLDQTVDENPAGRHAPNPLVTGVGGGHDIDLRHYAALGVRLLGRLQGARDTTLFLAGDLAASIAEGDRAYEQFTRAVDEHVGRTGTEARDDGTGPRPPGGRTALASPPTEIDLRAAGITSVVWATGFRYEFDWVKIPVFDAEGQPVQRRGVTAVPGLYFLGLPWMHTLKSSVLCGVGADAAHLAEIIAA